MKDLDINQINETSPYHVILVMLLIYTSLLATME